MRTMLLFLLAVPAYAAEPINVRGVELGDTQTQVLEAVPDATCEPASNGRVDCTFWGYGPDPRALSIAHLLEDRVYLVHTTFDHMHYSTVRDGLTLKFGAPQIDRMQTLTNAMGAEFSSKDLAWQTAPGRMLILSERDGKIDRSAVKLADVAGLKEAKARRESDPKSVENL